MTDPWNYTWRYPLIQALMTEGTADIAQTPLESVHATVDRWQKKLDILTKEIKQIEHKKLTPAQTKRGAHPADVDRHCVLGFWWVQGLRREYAERIPQAWSNIDVFERKTNIAKDLTTYKGARNRLVERLPLRP